MSEREARRKMNILKYWNYKQKNSLKYETVDNSSAGNKLSLTSLHMRRTAVLYSPETNATEKEKSL